MQRYPNDLLVHDRAVLENAAHPGAFIAWMVGDSHTHIVSLGVHQKENACVTYLTNLASSDHFYTLRIHADRFELKEIGRKAFGKLNATPVPYQRTGTAESFWLCRHDTRIGHCKITRTGDYQSYKYTAEMSPMPAISALDKTALQHWASQAITEITQSLFTPCEFVFADPLPIAA